MVEEWRSVIFLDGGPGWPPDETPGLWRTSKDDAIDDLRLMVNESFEPYDPDRAYLETRRGRGEPIARVSVGLFAVPAGS